MIPTLLAFAKENKAYADDYGIFEIGHTVEGKRENGECDEQNKLGVVLYSKTQSEEKLFGRAVEIAREICLDILHKAPEFVSVEPEYNFAHPVNTFDILLDGVKVGYIGVPHPTVLENIDKKCAVAFVEIKTETFAKSSVASLKYSEPSKFPAIEIDVTFATDPAELKFGQLKETAKTAAGELLSDMWLKDIYQGDDGYAVTFRFAFLSTERTLTKQELNPLVDAIVAAYTELGIQVK